MRRERPFSASKYLLIQSKTIQEIFIRLKDRDSFVVCAIRCHGIVGTPTDLSLSRFMFDDSIL
jgi:hypothetical protein